MEIIERAHTEEIACPECGETFEFHYWIASDTGKAEYDTETYNILEDGCPVCGTAWGYFNK